MNPHPCRNGIDKTCILAYPEFTRRAIAYRILHVLIPPELYPILSPEIVNPLVGPGSSGIPWGELPPGTIVFPGVRFPKKWKPGYEYPEGVIPPPKKHIPMITPESPLSKNFFTEVFSAGPPTPPGPRTSSIGIVIMSFEGPGDTGINFGDHIGRLRISCGFPGAIGNQITSIKVKVGKVGSPTGNVFMVIQGTTLGYQPDNTNIVSTSNSIVASDLPDFDLTQPFVEFTFQDQPQIQETEDYCFVLARSTDIDAFNYFQVSGFGPFPIYLYWMDENNFWITCNTTNLEYEIWGYQ